MTDDPQDRAEELFAAWVADVEDGATADIEPLCAQNPELADTLRRWHADWRDFAPQLQDLLPGAASVDLARLGSLVGPPEDLPEDELRDLTERLGLHLPESRRYQFRGVIGRGGGGTVLKVWDGRLRRQLAMKIVLGPGQSVAPGSSPTLRAAGLARFVDEARIASQLDHPGIVPVHEIGSDSQGRLYFTMRLVEGEDLSTVFWRVREGHDRWTVTRALGLLVRACEAVAHAHDRGVLHRDLKPANIRVGRQGEVHVMDWGLARVGGSGAAPGHAVPPSGGDGARRTVDTLRAEHRTRDGRSPFVTAADTILGTPAYMAPEQARGDLDAVDTRSDVYAMGTLIYELLAGRPPYLDPDRTRDAHEVLRLLRQGPPTPLAEVAPTAPAELVAICERAMERRPGDRYTDMGALAADLRAYLENRVVRAHRGGAWVEARKWVRRNRALAAALLLAVLTLIGGALGVSVKADEALQHAAETRWEAYVGALLGADAFLRLEEIPEARELLASAPQEHRHWEWDYLWAETDRSVAKITGDMGRLFDQVQIPGTSLALVRSAPDQDESWVGHELLVDLETRRVVDSLGFFDWARPTSPHQTRFARTTPGALMLVPSPNMSFSRRPTTVSRIGTKGAERLLDLPQGVSSSCFSSTGEAVIAASDDLVMLWSVPTGRLVEWIRTSSRVTSVEGLPGARSVLVGTQNGQLLLLDETQLDEVACVHAHQSEIRSITVSEDGSLAFTVPREGFGSMWSIRRTDEGPALLLVEQDQGGRLVHPESGEQLWVHPNVWGAGSILALGEEAVSAMRERNPGWLLASPGGGHLVESSRAGPLLVASRDGDSDPAALHGPRGYARWPIVLPGDSEIAAITGPSEISVWPLRHELTRPLRPVRRPAAWMGFEPTVAWRDGPGFVAADVNGLLGSWVSTEVSNTRPHWLDECRDLSGCQDVDAVLAVGASGFLAALLDSVTLAPRWTLREPVSPGDPWYEAGAATPDATLVALANDDFVTILDTRDDRRTGQFATPVPTTDMAFVPHEDLLVAVGEDGLAIGWGVASASMAWSHEPAASADDYRFIALEQGGRRAVLGTDSELTIVDVGTGEILTGPSPAPGLTCAVFTPDGERLVTGGGDLRVWDPDNSRLLLRLDVGEAGVHAARFTEEGAVLNALCGGELRLFESRGSKHLPRQPAPWSETLADAEADVLSRLAKGEGLQELADAIRSETTITQPERSAALTVIAGLCSEVHVALATVMEACHRPEHVLETLEATTALSAAQHHFASEVLEGSWYTASILLDECEESLEADQAPGPHLACWAWTAARAHERAVDDGERAVALTFQGAFVHRLGQLDEARDLLSRAHESTEALVGTELWNWERRKLHAYRSLNAWALGDRAAARAHRDRLLDLDVDEGHPDRPLVEEVVGTVVD